MTAENIFDIKINEEYANLVPPSSTSEYQSLKEDIRQNGIRLPIVTNEHSDILDGHHRYKIWSELGRPVQEMSKPIVMRFEDKLDERLFVINVNLKRRHLNDFQKTELSLKAKPILEELAKRNQKLGGEVIFFKSVYVIVVAVTAAISTASPTTCTSIQFNSIIIIFKSL
jgi:ParB/Sulfiredoxin domain